MSGGIGAVIGEVEIIALVAGFLLGVIHFLSEGLTPRKETHKFRIISFAAGISIAYLFLDLLPHTYDAATVLKEWVFVFLLLGFAVFHLIEKMIYQHANQDRLAWELKEVHSVSFFLYYFLIGIVIKDELQANLLDGILLLIPVSLHAALSTVSLSRIHGDVRESPWVKAALSLSSLLGVVFALFIHVPSVLDHVFISVIAGVLLYIIVKEFLPEKKEGQPLFFILGITLFLVFYVLINL